MDDGGDMPLPKPEDRAGGEQDRFPRLELPRLREAVLCRSSYLDFAKQFYADAKDRQANLDNVAGKVVGSQLDAQDTLNGWAAADRDRLEKVFQPLQDQYIADAQAWDSPERQAAVAAEARGDVVKAAASQDAARRRQQASMGVNPNSGRWAGADRAADTATALGAAGAENRARSDLRLQGMRLRASAIGMGNGLAGQASAALATGAQIGNSATGNVAAANSANIKTAGIMQSGTQTAIDGYTKQAGVLTNLYNGQLSAWNAQNNAASQSNSDLMGAIGTGAGLIFSDENAKENKEPATGTLEAVRSMPVQEWDYKPGMGDGERHIGTYAQHFKAATGKGDGHSIPVIDAVGVTMGAVKELDAKVEKLAKGLPAYDRKGGEPIGRGGRGIRQGAS